MTDDYDPFQCGIDYAGGRGVTTWNLNHQYTLYPDAFIKPGTDRTVTFNCSKPKCYDEKDACLAVFNAWRTGSGTTNATIHLDYILNGSLVGGCYLSGVATHGATQAWDMANAEPAGIYNDEGANTFIIRNTSNSTIQVDHFKVIRAYAMCNLWNEKANACTFTDDTGCRSIPTGIGAGSFNSFAVDTPCNLGEHGGLSYTFVEDFSHQGSIIPKNQGSVSWTFDFSGEYSGTSGGNYLGESICYFNFNQMWPDTDSSNADVTIDAHLNGTRINTYYLSKYKNEYPPGSGTFGGMFPSHDLASSTSPATLQTGLNTVTLINKSNDVDVRLATSGGGINIYRIFRTAPVTDHTPTAPSVTGPQNGSSGVQFTFNAVSHDNESDKLTYAFYWDMQSTSYAYGASGETVSSSFTYNSSGPKTFAVRTKNPLGTYTDYWSAPTYRTIVIDPSLPDPPTPLNTVSAGTTYLCCGPFQASSAIAPCTFEFNWNDGTTTAATYANPASAAHTWTSTGTKNVTVRVKNAYNQWSNPATFPPTTIQTETPAGYYVTSIVDYGYEGGGGYVDNLQGFVGAANDGSYGEIIGGGPFDGGWIVGSLNEQATGKVEFCAYGEVPPGAVHVSVSNDNQNFTGIASPSIPTECPTSINCGIVSTPFKYIKISALDPESATYLYVDSMRVTPTAYCTLTVTTSGGGSMNPSGGNQYPINVEVPVQAYPDALHDFSHWIKDSTITVYNNPCTIGMDASHTLEAVFSEGCGACQECQTGCEVSCQTQCDVSCQVGCEVSCYGCQTACEFCESCDEYCVACQDCQVCEAGCLFCEPPGYT